VTRAPDPYVARIRDLAAGCTDLLRVAAVVERCTACPDLAARRTSVVVGEFPPAARLLVVGEAPGAQEDVAGRPFIGKGGRLLDRLLSDAGIDRAGVAVANTLKCRPPDNRTPTRAEVHRCRGWLDRQVELANPALLLTLGGTALAWAFGPGHRLGDLRGRVHERNGRPLIPSYHPSAALRFGPNGAPMAALAEDLRLAAKTLAALG
jgi:uracil-DNA glycosylase